MMNYTVRKIESKLGREYICRNHYTRGCHNGPMCWGLFDLNELIGVCAFATPSSENVRASVFGPEYKQHVTELHRLHVQDGTPTNTESWFITRALSGLHEYRPGIWGVLSFADGTEGHVGTIYQATNALYLGTTGRSRFWRDQNGRLHHPRQNGHNVTPAEAAARGWKAETRDAKYRYLFLVGDGPAHRRKLRKMVLRESLPYPKRGESPNLVVLNGGENGIRCTFGSSQVQGRGTTPAEHPRAA